MSLPVSKLVCGIGDAPVTGAWIPMTISLSVIPAVSFGSLLVRAGRARTATARGGGRRGPAAGAGRDLTPGDAALLTARGREQDDDERPR